MKARIELKAKEDELYDELDGCEEDRCEYKVARGKLDAIGFLLGETDPITDDEDASVPQSDEDLDRLIATLKAERENIAEYSFFGDPNWKVCDAQIEICEWAKGT